METNALRQLLKNLCTNSQWSYAVFWKLQQIENHKLLTCEDVYCDSETSQQPCQSILSEPNPRQEAIFSLGYGKNICDDVHYTLGVGYPIGFAVADMSCCQYMLGEGVVGRAALAESDCWIFSDNNESIELISNLGYADDWLLPIAAGIKTTLLAPLLPYGVLQLGSFEKVDESQAICADIRDRFFTLTYTTIIPLPSNGDTALLCSSILMAEPGNNDESSFTCNNLQRMEYEDTNIIHDVEFIENDLPTTHDQLVPLMDENFLELEESCFIDDQNIFYPYLDTNAEPNANSELVLADTLGATAMWMFSCHEEEFDDARDSPGVMCSDFVPKQVKCPPAAGFREDQTNSRNIDDIPRDCEMQEEAAEMWIFSRHEEEFDDVRISAKSCGEICSDSIPEEVKYPSTAESRVGHTDSRNLNYLPRDCELQEALLQPVFKLNDDRHSGCMYKENEYSDEGFCFSTMESYEPFDESGKQDHLLEDVVATSYNISYDDNTFYRCDTSKSSVNSLAETAPYDTVSIPGECNTMSDHQYTFCMTSASSLESLESAIVEDKQQLECAPELLDKNVKKPKHSRGKQKPKSIDRPRPRDRQLIQDRLKVLRKLVPDGAKCSIDGLLDQTVKHMMFLRSVTERAEKVKHFISQEIASVEEGGNNFEACPIIVKDLEHPSQFMIQMVCVDEGVFFEIAEVMYKLKLTILKGAMENRRNKWASFIVEASKGFNKLDIFWPLMRILQQNGTWMTDQLCP